MDPPIINDEKESRFVMKFENGEEALIDYRIYNGNEFDLYHTYVPASLRGRNIADKLSTFAMDHVKRNNGKALLSCTYLSDKWLPQHYDNYIKFVIRSIKK